MRPLRAPFPSIAASGARGELAANASAVAVLHAPDQRERERERERKRERERDKRERDRERERKRNDIYNIYMHLYIRLKMNET